MKGSSDTSRRLTETPPRRLTKREEQILRVMREGHSAKAAAGRLCVSTRTVEFHLHNIYQKLEVHSLLQALNAIEGRELPMEERQD